MASAPEVPLQSRVMDDKSPICIPFILERLTAHQARNPTKPFIIGLNGVQGVGKTTLVKALAEMLDDREGLKTLVVSIDDFYLTHADQLALAAAHPDNALVQNRGEPGKLRPPVPPFPLFILPFLSASSHPPRPHNVASVLPFCRSNAVARWGVGGGQKLKKGKPTFSNQRFP